MKAVIASQGASDPEIQARVDLIDLDHAERELFEYIEMFYNNQRLHAYLDYVSPALFERLSLQKAA